MKTARRIVRGKSMGVFRQFRSCSVIDLRRGAVDEHLDFNGTSSLALRARSGMSIRDSVPGTKNRARDVMSRFADTP